MTLISALAGAPGAASSGSPLTVIRAAQPVTLADASATPRSSVVMLGQGISESAGSVYDETGTVPDALAAAMAKGVAARTRVSPFADVGAALLNRFRTDGASHAQWAPAARLATPATAEAGPLTEAELQPDNTVSLRITTASGVKVQVSLQSGKEGMAVQVDVAEGELNEDERRAIAALSGAFQDALDGLAEVPPRWSLTRLANGGSPLLSSISLSQSRIVDGATQTIDFQADSKQKSLTVSNVTGVVKVDVDLTKPVTLGSATQQQAAVAKYLQQFDRAQRRGSGDEALMGTFKDVFLAMHGSNGAAQVPAADTTTRRLPAADAHRSLLSGLADFSASIDQVREASNPMRPKEIDGFSYQASQTSQVSGKARWDLAVSQEQSTTLTANYHRSLSPDVQLALTQDEDSQNYLYFQIHDSSKSKTDVAYEDGVLTQATLNESRTQTTQVSKYIKGKLVDQSVMPSSESNSRNLLSLVRAAKLDELDDPMAPRDQADEILRRKYLDLARQAADARMG
ncbi:MAG: hypothetical protein ACN6P8_03895 [Achromobacter piechaudii]